MSILSLEAKTYLENVVGDLNVYITNTIQAQVKMNKIQTQAQSPVITLNTSTMTTAEN